MRHQVNVMRPTTTLDSAGQPSGQDSCLIQSVPCSIDPLSSTEPEIASQQTGITTYRVEMYGDPNNRLRITDYLTLGNRRLNIAEIVDVQQNGQRLVLTCGERHDP